MQPALSRVAFPRNGTLYVHSRCAEEASATKRQSHNGKDKNLAQAFVDDQLLPMTKEIAADSGSIKHSAWRPSYPRSSASNNNHHSRYLRFVCRPTITHIFTSPMGTALPSPRVALLYIFSGASSAGAMMALAWWTTLSTSTASRPIAPCLAPGTQIRFAVATGP